ncbi:tail fiber protein, partial [Xenorhabdus szentirmaii]|uniref:tail fiber protein n=1 Tax=Xenorhabdus szentirmaii TaxID=290112 RepID=UPI0019A97BD6
ETHAATPKAVKATYDLARIADNNANGRLEKSKNGADIPNKDEFVKNLGLGEGSALPVGVPVPWPLETPPAGWLKCNGSAFDMKKCPKLAQVYPSGILPDLRGEFLRGWDDGRGVDKLRDLLSGQAATELPSIYIYADSPTSGRLVTPPINSYPSSYPSDNMATNYESPKHGSGRYFSPKENLIATGSVELAAFSIRPRNIAFNYIVRAA